MKREAVIIIPEPSNYNLWHVDLLARRWLAEHYPDETYVDDTVRCTSLTPRGEYPKELFITFLTMKRLKKQPLLGSWYAGEKKTRRTF